MINVQKKLKRVLGGAALVVIFVALVAFVACSAINRNKNKPTFVFGYTFLWVETGSMEPAIPERSCILAKTAKDEAIAEGTVITFYCKDPASPAYGGTITHRVIGVTSDGYQTKGDNSAPDAWTVAREDVIAVYVRSLPVFTFCGRVFFSPFGLVLIAALFLGSCCFIYVPEVVHALRGEDGEKSKREREIEKRVKEEVEKMRRENGANAGVTSKETSKETSEKTNEKTNGGLEDENKADEGGLEA